MMAALFLRGVGRCRSKQLKLKLSFPPINHLENGGFDQSSTCFHGANQCSEEACSAQNLSGSLSADWYSCSYCSIEPMEALALNSRGGGNFSFSSSEVPLPMVA